MPKNLFYGALAALMALSILLSCSGEQTQPESEFNVSGIILPSSIECEAGGLIELKVVGGHGPQATDKVELTGDKAFRMGIASCTEKAFSFNLDEAIYSGDYVLSIVRGSQSKRVGKTRLTVRGGADIEPEGANVYGQVLCQGKGVAGVVVSDGVEVTATDANGIYRLNSQKKHGYVFISTPSGYETLRNGILPTFHQSLAKDKDSLERVDFSIFPAEGQDKHTMLIMGDMHLANRNTKDLQQFTDFVNDVNSFVSSSTGKIYGLTLGDMTWDQFWIVNSYGYAEYLRDAKAIKNLTIYHTIGNHDHSMYYSGDFDTVTEYKKLIGPTYYSFNVGKVHYVVLDDVKCTNATADTDSKGNPCYVREYTNDIVNEQFTWLEKDLSYVSTDTPLVISMHIPLYSEGFSAQFSSSDVTALKNIFAKYPETHLFTAHTHRIYNHDKRSTSKFYEHNAGAVCGTWWWSASYSPGIHLGPDGSPGGYTVLNVNGKSFSWQFKATGSDVSYQFRTYDRNNICLTTDRYMPNATTEAKNQFAPGIWKTASSGNEVYANVWNYDPSWKVQMFEGATELAVSQVTAKDPLHLMASTAKRLNNGPTDSFLSSETTHMFKATASSATSTITVQVTDGFGNVYKETMTRPKAFDITTYEK